MDKTSLYDVLELKLDASAEEIKSSYRRLAKLYHPDKHPEGSLEGQEASKRFVIVSDAYEILKDPTERLAYDTMEGFSSHNVEQKRKQQASPSRTTTNRRKRSDDNSVTDTFYANANRMKNTEELFEKAEKGFKEAFGEEFGFGAFSKNSKFNDKSELNSREEIFEELRNRMKASQHIYDAMGERMKNNPIFDELRDRVRTRASTQGSSRDFKGPELF